MSFNIEWTNADALTPKQFTVYESMPVTYSTTTAPFGDLQREVRAGSSRFELLPCPFCGGKARYVYKWCICTNSDSVVCTECGAAVCRDSEANAIAAWNRRWTHERQDGHERR